MKKVFLALSMVLFTSSLNFFVPALARAGIFESSFSSKKPDLKTPLPHIFGINIDNDPGIEQEFNATQQANFKWVRLWFSWRNMEHLKEGEINWTEMDRQVEMAIARRLNIFATFWGIPGWANKTPPDCQPWSTFNCSYPPTDRKFFGNFVRKVVARYKGRIKYWGLGNEPNHGAFWNRIPAQGGKPEQTTASSRAQYMRDYIEPGGDAIRAEDPQAKIVGPDLCNIGSLKPDEWMKEILTKQAKYFDIISGHEYAADADAAIKKMAHIRDVIVATKNGNEKKPFWMTELGFDIKAEKGRSEHTKAQNYLKVLSRAPYLSWWRGTFIYRISDQPSNPSWKEGQHYGIIGPQTPDYDRPTNKPFMAFEPHEAFFTIQKYLASLPGVAFFSP